MERPDIEIVGLDSSTNGRSCTCHATCGQYVFVDDILRLVRCVVTVNGVTEEAIKLVKITDATDSCTVAYVPRVSVNLPKISRSSTSLLKLWKITRSRTIHGSDAWQTSTREWPISYFLTTFLWTNKTRLVKL
jgi:hypothetical protein